MEHLETEESKQGQSLKNQVLRECVTDAINKVICLKPAESQLPTSGVRTANPMTITLEQNGVKEKTEDDKAPTTGKTPMTVIEDRTAPENAADTEMALMTAIALAECAPHHQGQGDTGHPHHVTHTMTSLHTSIWTDHQ